MTNAINPQLSFAGVEYANKKKLTRRDRFLASMETVVPWDRIVAVIEPYYPRGGKRGRPPIGLPRMLRMYFIQQ
jgi:IS5 family transposase